MDDCGMTLGFLGGLGDFGDRAESEVMVAA